MKTEVKEIPFNNGSLLGVRTEDENVWLAVKKACLDIGLTEGQADRQIKNLKNDLIFTNHIVDLNVKFDGQVRKVICVSEKFVTLWLAKISLTPKMKDKNPEAVQKLLTYQLEAADVLHKAFYETEEQKAVLHSNLGLKGVIAEMKDIQRVQTVQINNMEETLEKQTEMLSNVMENMTLSTRQQHKLNKAAKDRVSCLLGGAHSKEYKDNAKSFFINLWNGLKSTYKCASYKDLNPKYYDDAFDYISTWQYKM